MKKILCFIITALIAFSFYNIIEPNIKSVITNVGKKIKNTFKKKSKTKSTEKEVIDPNMVTITNSSNNPINVIFESTHCEDKSPYSAPSKCKEIALKPNESTSYIWKWQRKPGDIIGIDESEKKVAINIPGTPLKFLTKGAKGARDKLNWQGFKFIRQYTYTMPQDPSYYGPPPPTHKGTEFKSINPDFALQFSLDPKDLPKEILVPNKIF